MTTRTTMTSYPRGLDNNASSSSTAPAQMSMIGSQTQTQTQTQTPRTQPVLHLRGAEPDAAMHTRRRRIQWAENVVDNEGLGRKSSKVCCIYHAPKAIDESSDESSSGDSSSSSSSSDDGNDESGPDDDGMARPVGGRREERCGHGHEHGHGRGGHGCVGHGGDDAGAKREMRRKNMKGKEQGKGKERGSSPNAYEKMPRARGDGPKRSMGSG